MDGTAWLVREAELALPLMGPALKKEDTPMKAEDPMTHEAEGQTRRNRSQHSKTRQRTWLWLVAALLLIVFLAGECAKLLPIP